MILILEQIVLEVNFLQSVHEFEQILDIQHFNVDLLMD